MNLIARGVALALLLALGACELATDNEGRTYNTTPGETLDPSWLLGKWDLDGERTNAANGNSGVTAIPDDVLKDVFGAGWRFERDGVLLVDGVLGSRGGTWRLEEPDTLVLKLPEQDTRRYRARFTDGYLYLTGEGGRVRVMERSKFFGF
jgi:hypothetical protein